MAIQLEFSCLQRSKRCFFGYLKTGEMTCTKRSVVISLHHKRQVVRSHLAVSVQESRSGRVTADLWKRESLPGVWSRFGRATLIENGVSTENKQGPFDYRQGRSLWIHSLSYDRQKDAVRAQVTVCATKKKRNGGAKTRDLPELHGSGRRFLKQGNPLTERQRKYCDCLLEVKVQGRTRNPYGPCRKSTRPEPGSFSCMKWYDAQRLKGKYRDAWQKTKEWDTHRTKSYLGMNGGGGSSTQYKEGAAGLQMGDFEVKNRTDTTVEAALYRPVAGNRWELQRRSGLILKGSKALRLFYERQWGKLYLLWWLTPFHPTTKQPVFLPQFLSNDEVQKWPAQRKTSISFPTLRTINLV
jgi:hypothetical protein